MGKFGKEEHIVVQTEDGEATKHSIHFHLINGGLTVEVGEYGQLVFEHSHCGDSGRISFNSAFDKNRRVSFRELARFFDRVADAEEPDEH